MSEPREDYTHGSRFEKDGEEYIDDHINGVNWHRPPRRNEDDEYTEEDREFDDWINDRQ